MKLLLVEDHKSFRGAVATQLMSMCDVTGVATKAEALRALELHQFDAMILDVHLPDAIMTAAEIAEIQTASPGIPILVISGEATAEVSGRIIEAGHVFLEKGPQFWPDLMAKIISIRDDLIKRMKASPGVPAHKLALEAASHSVEDAIQHTKYL